MTKLILAVFATLVAVTVPAKAQTVPPKQLVNVDQAGLGIQGFDPVAYFTDQKPVPGHPSFTSRFLGVTYRFASAEHQAMFDAAPPKYAPQFGGYCGYGASRGYPAPIDPEAFTILNGRLILQNSKSVLERWLKDPDGYLAKADANWPSIVEKHGKP